MAGSVRLTKNNYLGESLHPTARDTKQSPLPATEFAVSSQLPAGVTSITINTTVNMNEEVEEDYMRPPESSDEDDSQQVQEGPIAVEPAASSPRPLPPLKRKREEVTGPTRQSKRKKGKLQDTKDDLPSLSQESGKLEVPSRVENDYFDPLSQSRSQKQRQKTYTSSKRMMEFQQIERLRIPVDNADPPEFSKVKETVIEEETVPSPVLNVVKASPIVEAKAPPVFKNYKSTSPPPALKTFKDLPPLHVGSSASTATSDAPVMDLTSSPAAVRLRGSRSTSPLTSLSSDDGLNDISSKPAFNNSVDLPTTPCPVCRKPIDKSLLPSTGKGFRSLSLQRQQDICHQHRLSEAKSQARSHQYPILDWDHVEKTRIPSLIENLRRVLQRKVRCFYLDELDKQVASSKGKPKSLRSYLHTRVLDIAKPGYYGPKGEIVMAHVITQSLADDLRKVSKTDKTVTSAGVGPYVAAVLVPECTMRLVMQDMGTRSQERAREILADSTDIGRLLNPDDDHVQMFEQD